MKYAICSNADSVTKAERNNTTTEKECLAVLHAMNQFRPYLLCKEFTLVSDHEPLNYMHSQTDPGQRLMRWMFKFTVYQYKFKYKPGRLNSNADALSRNPVGYQQCLAEKEEKERKEQELNANKPNIQVMVMRRKIPEPEKPVSDKTKKATTATVPTKATAAPGTKRPRSKTLTKRIPQKQLDRPVAHSVIAQRTRSKQLPAGQSKMVPAKLPPPALPVAAPLPPVVLEEATDIETTVTTDALDQDPSGMSASVQELPEILKTKSIFDFPDTSTNNMPSPKTPGGKYWRVQEIVDELESSSSFTSDTEEELPLTKALGSRQSMMSSTGIGVNPRYSGLREGETERSDTIDGKDDSQKESKSPTRNEEIEVGVTAPSGSDNTKWEDDVFSTQEPCTTLTREELEKSSAKFVESLEQREILQNATYDWDYLGCKSHYSDGDNPVDPEASTWTIQEKVEDVLTEEEIQKRVENLIHPITNGDRCNRPAQHEG